MVLEVKKMTSKLLLILVLLLFCSTASAGIDYYEGFSAEGIHPVTPSALETDAGVLYKYDSDAVKVYISSYGIRYTVKADSGNHWVQYEFRNPNAVTPLVNQLEKSVTWVDLYSDVDITYYLTNHGLKQLITVHSPQPRTYFDERITVSDDVTYQKEENGEMWFYYAGERLFRIEKPVAIDVDENIFPIAISKKIIDSAAYIRLDASEALANCEYPLIIDPTTESGSVMYFWDEGDIPTLHATVADESKMSYDAANDTYSMHIPFYHNKSASAFAFNETVHLKSNNDENEAYFRWNGTVTFNSATVLGWDTDTNTTAPKSDDTRAYIYSDSGAAGDISGCNMSYLGHYSMIYSHTRGVCLNDYTSDKIENNTFSYNERGIYVSDTKNIVLTNNTAVHNDYGISLYLSPNATINTCNASRNNVGIGAGIHISSSQNATVTNNIASNNIDGILAYWDGDHTFTNNIANSNAGYGILLGAFVDASTFTNNTASENNEGVWLSSSSDNLFERHNSSSNVGYDYRVLANSINNTLLNCDFLDSAYIMEEQPSVWIIEFSDGRILDIDDSALSMTCNADNCTLTLEPTAADYTISMTTLDVTTSAAAGSVSVSANSTLVNIDYENSMLNDLNITSLDRQLILESAGVQTMVFDPTNVFNLWNFEYYINATANRKAVSFDTYTTNASNLINFTFHDLYPCANFDCKYNGASFITNTSGTTGTLAFNKSTWTANATKTIDIYVTTTPYRCGGVCAVDEGGIMMLFLDLNDTTVTDVKAEITKPNGDQANSSMTDFLEDGLTTWYLSYTDTGGAGTYTVNNFYSSKDGASWKRLDSFLAFTSRSTSGGSGGGGATIPDTAIPDNDSAAGGGGGQPSVPAVVPEEPEAKTITPTKVHAATFADGAATFADASIISIASEQSGGVSVDEYVINPTPISLINGERYGFFDISVKNPNVGGTVTFKLPEGAGEVAIYQLESGAEWRELSSTREGNTITAETAHFSFFAIADVGMRSVIESLTELLFDQPRIDGILLWHLNAEVYNSYHTANRMLQNVSSSEGVVCRISSKGDYIMRELRCVYTPPEDADFFSMKYEGEVVAVDSSGYVKRIPIKIMVYNFNKLSFPLFIGFVLIGGFVLYRKYY
jgi:parallel beta-helix repeat protein